MLLNLGEMLGALYSDLKYGSTPDADVTVRLKRLLNEAHRTILRTRTMSDERGFELAFNSERDQRYYGLPQAFDSLTDIRQMDSAIRLVMRPRDWLVSRDPQENAIGTPYVWVPNGMQPVSRFPPIVGSGLWAFSTSQADTTQMVRVMAVRAGAGLTTEQTATLNGTLPVRVGTLSDIAGIVQFTLSAPCVGDVSLIDAPDLPISLTLPPLPPVDTRPFPTAPVIDNFNRPDESPLSGGGQWQMAGWFAYQSLAVVGQKGAKASAAFPIAASYLNTRFGAEDAEAFVTVSSLATLPSAFQPYVAITLTPTRPGETEAPSTGYWLALVRINALPTYQLHFARFNEGQGVESLAVSTVTFAAGDAFGIERRGDTILAHLRNAGVWHQVGGVYPAAAHPVPLFPALVITDDTEQIRIDDFGGGPYSAHILGTIDRFAGTSQPYYSIRLWPTPQGVQRYTVKGTLRIADMVRDQDYPAFVQPEYCDALATYVRMREYKTVKADSDRFLLEQQEWERVIGGLNAAANFPNDYRPVAGAAGRERFSNLGGFYPADIGGDW